MGLLSKLFTVCEQIEADQTLSSEQKDLLKGIQYKNYGEYQRLVEQGVIKPSEQPKQQKGQAK